MKANTEVRFKIRRGSPVSKGCRLLINKPLFDERSGQYQTTITQPIPSIKKETDLDDKPFEFKGSSLDYKYLERVEQFNGDQSLNVEFRVIFNQAGYYFVQLEYFDEDLKIQNYTEPQYINVEPILQINGKSMRCKQLSMITVLSRCMGPLERWEEVLANISQLGYNAVHYTPIQVYGSSYSHYSLADQTNIDEYYFGERAKDLSREERISALKQTLDFVKDRYGLLGIVDIVLNHTASNSPWLIDHPESGYNTDDCPCLNSAYVFDKALSDFSDEFANRKISECPSAPYINNEADLKQVLTAMQKRVIDKYNFHEYFMVNTEAVVGKVRDCIKNELNVNYEQLNELRMKFDRKKWFTRDHYALMEDKLITNLGAERNQASVNLMNTAVYFYICNGQNEDKALQELRTLLNKHNIEWKAKVTGFMKEAMGGIEGTIKYFKLELKDNKITIDNKLLRRYFTELNNDKKSKVAHNGWIMNHNPMEDFALSGWHYLRRTINIWSDSVKLRYGKCPADSPFLWEHMSRYVSDMAMVFDGFRLDNAHSTPIHVCQYLLQIARQNNPNLFIMAELFTSSAEADALFVTKLNLNGLVRELQNTYSAKQLGDYFHQLTCREAVLGLIDQEFEDINGQKYKIMKPRKPNDIIYDCTHDNPSPQEKFQTPRIALSFIGVASMADSPIATTWGYDHLITKNLNVVTEKRLYPTYKQDDLFKVDGQDPKKNEKKEKTPERTPEKRTEFEYEFLFTANWAKRVQIAGCFTNWKPAYELKHEGGDTWKLKLVLPIIIGQDKYEYKYVVNENNWQINGSLPQTKDKNGNVNNYIQMPGATQVSQPFVPQQNFNSSEYIFPDIRYARMKLNDIHNECTSNNAEIFLHQQSADALVIIRQFQLDYSEQFDAYVSITRQCYFQQGGEYNYQTTVELPGYLVEVVFAGYYELHSNSQNNINDNCFIRGLNGNFKVYKDISRFCKRERVEGQEKERLVFFQMPPSFTCIVKTRHPSHMKEAVSALNTLTTLQLQDLSQQLFKDIPMSGLNHLLFRCEPEEKEISNQVRGPYGLSKYGQFVYSGLTSFIHILKDLKIEGDMGHEMFNNMREGNWFIDYHLERLGYMKDDLVRVIDFLRDFFGYVKRLNPSFKPKYASRVIEKVYNAAVYEIVNNRMKDRFVNNTEDLFLQKLSLGVVQMYGRVPSASFYEFKDTMCAGLPHFSTGYTRCWGRDTFIALRGLFISTGLQKEARDTIMHFAKVMRHGLIPNLHDRGNNTRFNARDATWFFLQAIKDYVNMMEQMSGGESILDEEVSLHFRDNDMGAHWHKVNTNQPQRTLKLSDLIHEILQAHAQGIEFREWNAGPNIDGQMKNEGFNVKIWTDPQTGFSFGGNQHNCGTWMDKMGSSENTGNKGIPATPRDGAPIEIVAMQYSVMRFMQEMSESGKISHNDVKLKDGTTWTYQQWAHNIKQNFERCFYVPISEDDDQNYVIDKKLIGRRGIYKDVFGSVNKYTEYQLRPNLCVAMAYAPDLFERAHARKCLEIVEQALMEKNCMGIKTLDPKDKNYRGDYINSDDSQGWNYHQGPEWLWPVGFFLKSKMLFSEFQTKEEIKDDIMKWLVPHQRNIVYDVWEGLPELTNSNGRYCKDSCTTQAWSISTIFDAMRDLHYM